MLVASPKMLNAVGGGREHDPGAGVSAVVYGDGTIGGVMGVMSASDAIFPAVAYLGDQDGNSLIGRAVFER